ncbi:MAG: Asp-tRNA(Asn)/Glu-tRNA(Gln) amidotransferase subunit GatA, partial [Gammaproteobacteria bacterium]
MTDLEELAIKQAKEKDQEITKLDNIPDLFAVPIAIKDNIST